MMACDCKMVLNQLIIINRLMVNGESRSIIWLADGWLVVTEGLLKFKDGH